MDPDGARILVTGATGELGGRFARALTDAGARVAVAGRDSGRLATVASELGDVPSAVFDARDPESCERAVSEAADALGGLDGLVLAVGVAGFGTADQQSASGAAEIVEVNLLGPVALVRATLGHVEKGGAIVGLSAIVADYPTAGMAVYSAAKAGLSAYLSAVRHERRRTGLTVLDVRPPHMDTGFSEHPVEGEAPQLPAPADIDVTVSTTLHALREGKREISWDLKARELVVR